MGSVGSVGGVGNVWGWLGMDGSDGGWTSMPLQDYWGLGYSWYEPEPIYTVKEFILPGKFL